MSNGLVEFRRLHDFKVVFRTSQGSENVTICIRELEDETLIAARGGNMIEQHDISQLLRPDDNGETSPSPSPSSCSSPIAIVQTFKGHKQNIHDVIELKRDVIVSVSSEEIKMWSVSSGQCLRSLDYPGVFRLVKLKEGFFATGLGEDDAIRVIDENGENVKTYRLEGITAMTRLEDGSLVYGNGTGMEIRRP